MIKFYKGNELDLKSLELFFQKQYKSSDLFGIKLLNLQTDQLGFTHYRYQQTFNGLPIEGTMYMIHVRNGKVETMNGFFFDHLSSSPKNITEQAAFANAKRAVPATLYIWQIAAEENSIKLEQNNTNATWLPKGELMYTCVNGNMNAENLKLCYRFDIYAVEPLARKYVFVDAATGTIVKTEDRIKTNDVVGTAITAYSGTQSMTADLFNGTYRLREVSRGNGIETYNLQHSTSNYSGAADFADADNTWNNVNAELDQYAADAHWGAEVVYDFYQTFFARNSIDGNGFKLKSYVHYGTNYVNAFWDGSRMTYGDGNATYKPLTTLDICGHEVSHGLTEFTSNLNYSYESGALNESFSDCMGEAMEFWKKPSTADWQVGEEIYAPFRSFSNPNLYGQPDTYLGTYWYTGGSDNGGVHTNSGVMNHWFYIVSVGEAGTNDNGAAYNITGITITKAQAILYRANTLYFTPSTDYNTARTNTIQAAIDLYGACTNEVTVVTNAWNAVGVGAVYNPTVTAGFYAGQTIFCAAPATVSFTNTSVNAGTFTWTFGDGTTSTLTNPTHTYSSLGVYNVKLVSSAGTCGKDSITKNSYINVSSTNACSYTMPQSGTGVTQTSCSGILYDSGGPSANYQDNTSSTLTISPTGASAVQLSFTSFNMEPGYDFFYVYDGASTASPLIATLTGNYIPSLIISSGPSITIKQTSDQGLTYSGYQINWNCSNASSIPVAAFKSDYTSTCSGIINFTDQSLNVPTSWLWNFGDGTTSTLKNPSHTYATTGTFTVMLTATNASGSNTITKTNLISVNKSAGPSTTGASVCTSGSVTLAASGSGTLNWYDASSGGNLVTTGTSYITPVLSATTSYYVEAVTSYAQEGVGPASKAIGSSSNYDNNTDRYLIFDVSVPVKLVSVRVYATGSGNRTIELRNSSNTTLLSKVVNMTDGEQVITLNWDLPVATALRLAIGGPANMQRNSTGAVYPYTLSGVVSITGNNSGLSGYYYWFYDWKLQQPTCITQRSTVTATVTVVPATITPAGSLAICAGSSVMLNANTGAGITYQWKLNGATISSATSSSYTATAAGDYAVVVSQSSCSTTSVIATVTVTTITASITPVGSTSICAGGSVVMNANTGAGITYQWKLNGATISGATSSSYTATSAGGYTVDVSLNGCTTASSIVTVSIIAAPEVSISANGSTSFCKGVNVTLTASPSGLIYQWTKNGTNLLGATLQTYTTGKSADFACKVTYSCATITSNTITLTQLAVPTATVTPAGTVNLCSGSTITLQANTGAALIYQWKKGSNVLSGETNSSLVVSAAGTYKVVVTNTSTGCTKTSAGTKIVIITCKENLINNNFGNESLSVYPNPTAGDVAIIFSSSAAVIEEGILLVKNLMGQIVKTSEVKINVGENEFMINMSSLDSGIYFVELKEGEKTFVAKVILEK
ncbi:MAG: M4 family metallopeptidase [Chitinophagales bacterium]|nr:M4 family metallopeptidase [Chitinophagales bacterium]